jgi:hypothetical protein
MTIARNCGAYEYGMASPFGQPPFSQRKVTSRVTDQGEIPTLRLGRRILVPREALVRMMGC